MDRQTAPIAKPGQRFLACCGNAADTKLLTAGLAEESEAPMYFFFRALWVLAAFLAAVGIALVALFALGAVWTGDELRAAFPHDPALRHAAPLFGAVLFITTIAPALTLLPALVAAVVGEVLRLRSWTYYVLAGGASLVAIPLLASGRAATAPGLPAGQWMTIFAAAGFIGGFVYWLLAGRSA